MRSASAVGRHHPSHDPDARSPEPHRHSAALGASSPAEDLGLSCSKSSSDRREERHIVFDRNGSVHETRAEPANDGDELRRDRPQAQPNPLARSQSPQGGLGDRVRVDGAAPGTSNSPPAHHLLSQLRERSAFAGHAGDSLRPRPRRDPVACWRTQLAGASLRAPQEPVRAASASTELDEPGERWLCERKLEVPSPKPRSSPQPESEAQGHFETRNRGLPSWASRSSSAASVTSRANSRQDSTARSAPSVKPRRRESRTQRSGSLAIVPPSCVSSPLNDVSRGQSSSLTSPRASPAQQQSRCHS
jgi:hypothetical protein